MASTVSGVHWKANYGEISEKARFRVGKIESDTWEASFPISELADLISVLQGVTPLPVGVIQKGAEVQARKVFAGFFTDIIVEPRSDTGVPAEIIRFGEVELTDLLYVLQLLAADLANKYPDDWDFSDAPITLSFDKYGNITNPVAQQAAESVFPVYRVWDGSEYPQRVEGALNIFFGPEDPGLAMSEDDYWANPESTTLDSVASALTNPSSEVYEALQATLGRVQIPLSVRDGNTAPFTSLGQGVYGFEMPPDVLTSLVGTVQVPFGWSSARVSILFYIPDGVSGDVRLTRVGSLHRDGSLPTYISSVSNTAVGRSTGTHSYLLTGNIDLTARDYATILVSRSGNSSADTLDSPVSFLSAYLERVS